MATKFTATIAFLVALVATSAQCSQLLEKESQTLTVAIHQMEEEFEDTIKLIFWNNKNQADVYVHMAGREQEAKELLNMAQVSTFIESVKYAIKHKSLGVIRDAIQGQRWLERGIVLYDTKLQMDLKPAMLSALVARVMMRAQADADRYTASYWGWLNKLIEHNLDTYPNNPSFRLIAVNSFQQLMKLRMDLQSASEHFEQTLDESLEAMQIDYYQRKHILALIDQMIEDTLGCRTCGQAAIDMERHQTRPMFDGESAIKRAVAEHVDPKLQAAMVEIEGAFEVSLEEQDRVTRADIDATMQRVIDGL